MSDRMRGSQPAQVPAPQPGGGSPATVLCVLLACFAGPKRAAKIRRQLDKRITGGGGTILDQVIVKIDAKHKVQVHDPHRTLVGTFTCALTWGIFGLLAGGLRGLGIWGWEEPLAKEPAGVYQHSDGRPLLGRKLAGKSVREMKDLGLAVNDPPGQERA